MADNDNIVFLFRKEVEAKIQILADVHSELIALGDMVKALLLDPEDMEKGTPEGIKIFIQKIQNQVDDVLNR
ncbi:hypothetical protein AGMMS50268_39170 [Spirochaetia bacterium]|nr:hypothetical protein AGMMS50268_39170 [Spirochaetia bacterium]